MPRAGRIDLRNGNHPRGLPLIEPLYGPGPYQYRGDNVLLLLYTCDEEALSEVLPSELEPLEGNLVVICCIDCPDVNDMGPHNFTMPCIPVRYGDYTGQYVPYLYTSTDASLACYREAQGWPAVLGETTMRVTGDRVQVEVTRAGRRVLEATAEVSGAEITSLDFLPIILYKEIPSLDGREREVAYLETSTSRFEKISFRAGSGTLVFHGDEPITRLRVGELTQALYGTMDDFYPETIRVLHRY